MARLAYLLCVLLAVPILGGVVAFAFQNRIDASAVCPYGSPLDCRDIEEAVGFLSGASLGVGGAGLLLLLSFWSAARLIGSNRRWLALVFPPLVRIAFVAMAVIILVQTGMLLYMAVLGRFYAKVSVVVIWVLPVAIGGLFVCAVLIRHALALGGRQAAHVVSGRLLDRQTYPQAHALVDSLAQRLGSRSPDNLVVGLDATFFASSGKVHLLDQSQPLVGESLFLSLPLCRALAPDEIAAIIGHELAHFSGHDTLYSLRFAPVYSRLISALFLMARPSRLELRAATMPAMAMLAFMLDIFSRNETTISRARELEADRAATEVASVEALATALVKTAAFTPLWAMYLDADTERVSRGLATRNLSAAFGDCIRYDVDSGQLAAHLDETLKTRIAHPVDTHPSIAERLAALDWRVAPAEILTRLIPAVDGTAATLGDLDTIEQELTAQHREMLLAADISPPKDEALSDEQKRQRSALRAAYALGAEIIAACGGATEAQRAVAEQGPAGLAAEFSRTDFRERLRYPPVEPDTGPAAHQLAAVLADSDRRAILEWLERLLHAVPEPPPSAVARYRLMEQALSREP